jgi:hypothetical protein
MGRAASYRRIGLRMGEVEQGRMERKEVYKGRTSRKDERSR